MAAVPFRLNIDEQPQYPRWANQVDGYVFATHDILKGVRQYEDKVKPEVQRLRAEIHEPTTKSVALSVEIICLIALKALSLAGGWVASNAIYSAAKPPIFSLISRISYASTLSWVIAFIVSTIALNIMMGISDWVLEPFRKKVIEMEGFKFMQEVYKVRGCIAKNASQISKVEEEEKSLQAVALKEGGMTPEQKALLLEILSGLKQNLTNKKTELEKWYEQQNVNQVVGWHRFVIPLLEEKDFIKAAIFLLLAP